MITSRFYLPQKIQKNKTYENNCLYQHLIRVLRIRTNDRFVVFNGDGFDYACQIKDINKKQIKFTVTESIKNNNESNLKITLYLQISQRSKFEYSIQKATELGVFAITPIVGDKNNHKLNKSRIEKIIISSCEQSQRAVIPKLNNPLKISDVTIENSDNKFILHPCCGAKLLSECRIKKDQEISLIIGSQSGFSAQEIEVSQKNGWQLASLGNRVLRTETAPIVALTVLQTIYGDI